MVKEKIATKVLFNNLSINGYINATLHCEAYIDGQIEAIYNDGFLIDDNITGDVFVVKYEEIKKINKYIK